MSEGLQGDRRFSVDDPLVTFDPVIRMRLNRDRVGSPLRAFRFAVHLILHPGK